MALIKCSECDREIFDRASIYPGCRASVAEVPRNPSLDDVQSVELTGKHWKGSQIIGALMLFVGVFLTVGGSAADANGMMLTSIFLIIFVTVAYLGACIDAW